MQIPFNSENRPPLLDLTEEDFARGFITAQQPESRPNHSSRRGRHVGLALLYGCVLVLAALAIRGSQRPQRFVLAAVSERRAEAPPDPATKPTAVKTIAAEPVAKTAPPRGALLGLLAGPKEATAPKPTPPAPPPAPPMAAEPPAKTEEEPKQEPKEEEARAADEPAPAKPEEPATTADGRVKLPGIDD